MIRKILINGKYYEIDGKSAYEVAVENGYKGTVEDWLNSLKGKTPQKGTDYFTEEDIKKIVEEVNISTKARIGYVTLLADAWVGADSPFTQVVTVEGSTKNSQVDLTPSDAQLDIFHEKDLAFVTKNYKGVVTVSAIGQKPQNDYEMQVTITEVENTDENSPIIGVTVGTSLSPSKIKEKVLSQKIFPFILQKGYKDEDNATRYNLEIGKEYKGIANKASFLSLMPWVSDDGGESSECKGHRLTDEEVKEFTLKIIGMDGFLLNFEFCGELKTIDYSFNFFNPPVLLTKTELIWEGELYLCNPEYITELVLNSLPKAGDWVL